MMYILYLSILFIRVICLYKVSRKSLASSVLVALGKTPENTYIEFSLFPLFSSDGSGWSEVSEPWDVPVPI